MPELASEILTLVPKSFTFWPRLTLFDFIFFLYFTEADSLTIKPFELPLGIKLWSKELSRQKTLPCEGYSFAPLEDTSDSYRFTVATTPEKIPVLFRELCGSGLDEAFLILEYYRNEQPVSKGEAAMPEVFYSPYLPVNELFSTLEPYIDRLIHDGFVGFGLANNRSGTEIFYSEEKVLSCFTDNHIRTMNHLSRLGIKHVEDMVFHTDLGHDHLSLLCHDRETLPDIFAGMNNSDLDFVQFCGDLVDKLGMYAVEETLSFFLSKREQDLIEVALDGNPAFADVAAEDFGAILLDWNDFVGECESGFEGDLEDYRMGLHLRDIIDHVVSNSEPELGQKILDIIIEPDQKFRQILTDCRKRLDPPPHKATAEATPFWYQGVVGKQGFTLRRDLIRQGWFRPHP